MKSIVITISETYLSNLRTVADELCEEGLTITNLFEFGVITGHADEEILGKLRDHKEVISLTEEKQATIPPPDSPVQ
ncbi:hypothetical protein DYBT9623_02125 [Dyadobacter sp. CECT 9623]|uniref:Uncharacterized protein n=1 Tax=Dyadobacter linearis TaxID=2823330 RepID=A0ABN7RB04_9BACT|nr:hypothetical protein [Dyadobacter sp. CECT 9623]CAG5069389.1 hypothetical protein DYBT9623_02125 [Dyadobacter sp. CECT 9623]